METEGGHASAISAVSAPMGQWRGTVASASISVNATLPPSPHFFLHRPSLQRAHPLRPLSRLRVPLLRGAHFRTPRFRVASFAPPSPSVRASLPFTVLPPPPFSALHCLVFVEMVFALPFPRGFHWHAPLRFM